MQPTHGIEGQVAGVAQDHHAFQRAIDATEAGGPAIPSNPTRQVTQFTLRCVIVVHDPGGAFDGRPAYPRLARDTPQAKVPPDGSAEWQAGGEGAGVQSRVNRRRPRTPYRDAINRGRSRVRAHVEHPFHVIKRLWGFTTVRYRGLYKNTVRAMVLLMLSNLYLLRRLVPSPA
ncbi:MAG: transposase [Gemmatimonadales bacterium]